MRCEDAIPYRKPCNLEAAATMNSMQDSLDDTILPIPFKVSIPASDYWVFTQINGHVHSKL